MQEECLKEGQGVAPLSLGGGQQREIGAEGGCAQSGAISEADFAEDDRESEALLGVIIGGFHAVDVEEGKEAQGVALGIDESLPEVFGVRMNQGCATKRAEAVLERGFALSRGGEGNQAAVPGMAQLAAVGEEIPKTRTEG